MSPIELTFPEQINVWDKRMSALELQLTEPQPELMERVGAPPNPSYKALDIGCGWGRHVSWLAELGWRVTGLDWAPSAVNNCRGIMREQGVVAQVVKGDMRRMPFGDGEFQIIVAVDVLQHGRLVDFKRTMTEVKRVLRLNCDAVFSVPSVRNKPLRFSGSWIEDNTLVMTTGVEAGIPHHFFTEEEIHQAAPMFRDVEIEPVVHALPPGFGPLHEDHVNEWYWVRLRG